MPENAQPSLVPTILDTHRYRIHVRHSHLTDPLLQRMTIAIRRGDTVLAAQPGAPGDVSFYDESSPGAEYTLLVTVPAPNVETSAWVRPYAQSLLTIEQRFRIDSAGRLLGVSAITNGHRTEGFSRRVLPLGAATTDAADPTHALSATLSLRLAFLDITGWVTHARQVGMVTWLGPTAEHGVTLDASAQRQPTDTDAQAEKRVGLLLASQPAAGQVTFDPRRMNGCQLRVLYSTRDTSVWAVLVPPTFRPQETGASVVFARGYNQSFRGVEDFPMRHVATLLEQAAGPGFGVGAYRGRTPFRGLFRLVEGGPASARSLEARRPSEIVHPAWTASAPVSPPYGIDRQLVASKKKAVFAWVIRRSGGPTSDDAARPLTLSLLATLHEAGVLSPASNTPPAIDKIIHLDLTDAAPINLADGGIDEAWLFRYGSRSAEGLSAARAAQLRTWLSAKPNRRLRFVQPTHVAYDIVRSQAADPPSGFFRTLALSLAPPDAHVLDESQRDAPITVWPQSPRFYFESRTFGQYVTVGRMRGHTAIRFEPFLDEVDEEAIRPTLQWLRELPNGANPGATFVGRQLLPTTPGSASEYARVFRVREREPSPDTLTIAAEIGRVEQGSLPLVVRTARLSYVHPTALAAILGRAYPASNEAEFIAHVEAINARFLRIQSHWAYYGAQCVTWKSGTTEAPASAVPYLQLCLELSQAADGNYPDPPAYPDTIELPRAESDIFIELPDHLAPVPVD